MMREAIVAVAAALAVAASPARAQPALFLDHGHALSFTSDGKALLAPSHEGLAMYRDGAWSELVGALQGYSGFSAAEHALYSSGRLRPGLAQGRPAGLLKSVDGGRTWQSLALAGEADFPLLSAGYRSGAIYVLNAGANSAMPSPGFYVTRDEGRNWRRAAARRLEGEIHALAAHPYDAGTVAAATGRGLYLSRDGGESFARLDGRELATGVAFDLEGKRLRYAHALSNEVVELALEGRGRRMLRLPALAHGDYVTCLAQSPADDHVLAFATRRRDLYLSGDAGRTWRRIAEGEELPDAPDAKEAR